MVELAQGPPPSIIHTYRAQAIEAIRISHELARSGMDPAESFTVYVLAVRA